MIIYKTFLLNQSKNALICRDLFETAGLSF